MAYYVKGYLPPSTIKNAEMVKALQKQIGAKTDGVFGKETFEKYMQATVDVINIDTPLIRRAVDYTKKYAGASPQIVRCMKLVESAAASGLLPVGANKLAEFALLFDGIREGHIDTAEYRIPYGRLDSNASAVDGSLFNSADCSSWVRGLFLLFFGIDIGVNSQRQWDNKKYQHFNTERDKDGKLIFDESKLQPLDCITYLSPKKASYRTVSHIALYLGGIYGRRIHQTTSPENPLRPDKLDYWISARVGVIRVLSQQQIDSITIKAAAPAQPPASQIIPADEVAKIITAAGKLKEFYNL